MNRDDPRHGTIVGYVRGGCRDRCCRDAITLYEKKRRMAILRGQQLTVPAGPVVRMIRELQALGWPAIEIARRCGWKSRDNVLNLTRAQRVRRETAAKVRAVYLELRGTEGPSEVTRRRAAAKGWQRPAIPVAYDGGWVRRGGVLVPTRRGAA